MKSVLLVWIILGLSACEAIAATEETFFQEVRDSSDMSRGLPSESAHSLVIFRDTPMAGTQKGLARYKGDRWIAVKGFTGKPAMLLASRGEELVVAYDGALHQLLGEKAAIIAKLPEKTGRIEKTRGTFSGEDLYMGSEQGLFRLNDGGLEPVRALHALIGRGFSVRALAASQEGFVAAATDAGLFEMHPEGRWRTLYPDDGKRRWAMRDLRGVIYDKHDRLWFASALGAGYRGQGSWKLFTGAEGLPFDDFTTLAAGRGDAVWFGTTRGAVRFDGKVWEYRQGQRWLPGDRVGSIAVDREGGAWFATNRGLGRIRRIRMTLSEKALLFEQAIEKRHRRTPYGFVYDVLLNKPGDLSNWFHVASDNDGLWTAMYGASQCFAYGATGSPASRRRAKKAFLALRFLGRVTQGGDHSPPPGFVARSILPAGAEDPNEGGRQRDRLKKELRDRAWKLISPRWPKSKDNRWYWKCDTSSDELDGHLFFYALYHDLVAGTPEEKKEVADVVEAIVDHLITHDFNLVDHDKKPTRWAHFGPDDLNQNPVWWDERGLNSLSILSYLKVAEQICGHPRYREAARKLINEHGYAINIMYPKVQWGPGTGNQSDDEMAFMNFYNLLRYEREKELIGIYAFSFHRYHLLELPELNPLFNFMYAAACSGKTWSDPWGTFDLSPKGLWRQEAMDTLKRFPLDRVNWRLLNSHRKDIRLLPPSFGSDGTPRGCRINGKVLPIDERHVRHWNHDPWELDQGKDGRRLADGAAFLLPYYMGLYHGYIKK